MSTTTATAETGGEQRPPRPYPVSYAHHFWGDKHVGYHVLYDRLKSGEETAAELAAFVRDRLGALEDAARGNAKAVAKLSSWTESGGGWAAGWLLVRNAFQVVGEIHSSRLGVMQELLKDVLKYGDDLVRSRRRVKEQDVVEAVNLMQTTTTCLQKAKETYALRCTELQRLQAENATLIAQGSATTNGTGNSAAMQALSKELSRAELKVARAREDYRAYVDKYERVRADFELKLERAAASFQAHDHGHLCTVRTHLTTFAKHWTEAVETEAQVARQLLETVQSLSVDALMTHFVEHKATGTQRPQPATFENLEGPTTTATAGGGGAQTATSPAVANLLGSPDSLLGELAQGQTQQKAATDLLFETLDWNATATTAESGTAQQIVKEGAKSPPVSLSSNESQRGGSSGSNAKDKDAQQQPAAVFSASFGRQKLAMFLPKRRKHASHNFDSTPANSAHAASLMDEFKSMNALQQQQNWGTEYARSSGASSSSRSAEKQGANATAMAAAAAAAGNAPAVDAEGYSIRPAGVDAEPPPSWASCPSSSSSEDEAELAESAAAAKLRALHIAPRSAAHMQASVDELREAVGHLALAPSKSRLDIADPWSASATSSSAMTGGANPPPPNFSQSYGGGSLKPPLRPSLTGDGRLYQQHHQPAQQQQRLPGDYASSTARARPRSHTPTFAASFAAGSNAAGNGGGGGFGSPSWTQQQLASWGSSGGGASSSSSSTVTFSGTQAAATAAAASTAPPAGTPPPPPLPARPPPNQTSSSSPSPWTPTTPTPATPIGAKKQDEDEDEDEAEMSPFATSFSTPAPVALGGFASRLGGAQQQQSMTPPPLAAVTVGSSSGAGLGGEQSQRVPLALALNEYLHCWLRADGSRKVRAFGALLVSWSSAAAHATIAAVGEGGVNGKDDEEDDEACVLKLRITHDARLKAVALNKQLVRQTNGGAGPAATFVDIDWRGGDLVRWLKNEVATKPAAAFYNAELARYELADEIPTLNEPPLLLSTKWTCRPQETEIRMDYRLNEKQPAVHAVPLLNVFIETKVDGAPGCEALVTGQTSEPAAQWNESDRTLSWTLTELTRHGLASGSLSAKLQLADGPTKAANASVQFQCHNTSLSAVQVDVLAPVGRAQSLFAIAMLRRKLLAGKYFAEPSVAS